MPSLVSRRDRVKICQGVNSNRGVLSDLKFAGGENPFQSYRALTTSYLVFITAIEPL